MPSASKSIKEGFRLSYYNINYLPSTWILFPFKNLELSELIKKCFTVRSFYLFGIENIGILLATKKVVE